MRIWIQGFNDKNSKYFTVKHIFLKKKNAFYLSLGIREKRPTLQEKLSALTENIQNFKTKYFCGGREPRKYEHLGEIRESTAGKSANLLL
jgi:hypothetical protein